LKAKTAHGGEGRRGATGTVRERYTAEYLQAVLEKQKDRSSSVVAKMLEEGFDMISAFSVLGDAQVEIGELWEKGVIGITDEQFSTATTLECITEVAARFRKFRRETRGVALLCMVEGEFHQVALRMLAELLRERGWDAVVTGHDAPVLDLVSRARADKGRIDLLCFSAVMPASIPPLVRALGTIRRDPHFSGTKIIVGGPLFDSKRSRMSLVDSTTGKSLADHVSTNLADAVKYLDSLKL
jgi:methanogenic corrinoid protein MtbC1